MVVASACAAGGTVDTVIDNTLTRPVINFLLLSAIFSSFQNSKMLLLFDIPIEKSLAPFICNCYTRPPPVGGGTSTSVVVDEPKEEAKEIKALNSSL